MVSLTGMVPAAGCAQSLVHQNVLPSTGVFDAIEGHRSLILVIRLHANVMGICAGCQYRQASSNASCCASEWHSRARARRQSHQCDNSSAASVHMLNERQLEAVACCAHHLREDLARGICLLNGLLQGSKDCLNADLPHRSGLSMHTAALGSFRCAQAGFTDAICLQQRRDATTLSTDSGHTI